MKKETKVIQYLVAAEAKRVPLVSILHDGDGFLYNGVACLHERYLFSFFPVTDYCVDPNVARADTSPTASTTISAMPSSVTTEISTDTPTSISTDTPTFVSTEMPSEESATLSLSTEVLRRRYQAL